VAKQEKLVPLAGSERRLPTGAREAGVPDRNQRIRTSVLLRRRSPLEELASGKEMSSSLPRERQYLTREEFAAQYGADPADVAKVEARDYCHGHNWRC